MKQTWTRWGGAARALFAALALTALAHADPVAGKDYTVLDHPQPVEVPGKVEVIEFFNFGCPHCNHFEPYVEAWAARQPRDVVFRRESPNFEGRTDWEPYVKLTITLKTMGKLELMAKRVFDAVHVQHIELRREPDLFDWIKQQGLNVEQFKSIWSGFSMSSQLDRAGKFDHDYQLDGVPEFVVNGKYLVKIAPGDNEGRQLFATINQLVTRERQAKH